MLLMCPFLGLLIIIIINIIIIIVIIIKMLFIKIKWVQRKSNGTEIESKRKEENSMVSSVPAES